MYSKCGARSVSENCKPLALQGTTEESNLAASLRLIDDFVDRGREADGVQGYAENEHSCDGPAEDWTFMEPKMFQKENQNYVIKSQLKNKIKYIMKKIKNK